MATEKAQAKSSPGRTAAASKKKATGTKTKAAAPAKKTNAAPKTARGRTTAKKSQITTWTMDLISHHIKEHAYYIWETEQRPQDKDIDIWLKAEREILSELIR